MTKLNDTSKKALAETVLRLEASEISDEFLGKCTRVAIETLAYLQNKEGDKVAGENRIQETISETD